MVCKPTARRLARIAAIPLLALVAACDDDVLMPPTATAGSMFVRYVSIGNSITSGFQSGGINDSTQLQSYAVLLAAQMGTTFDAPLLNQPGCPAPFTNIFTQLRLAGTGGTDCAFRKAPIPDFINNLAVPGANVADVLANAGAGTGANALTQAILGGRTQIQAAADAQPTFVTVWIGNNDVLGSITDTINAGDSSLVTKTDVFAQRYGAMMDSLDALGSIQGGALIGVVQVAQAPFLTQGRVWKGFEAQFDALTQSGLDSTFEALPTVPPGITLSAIGVTANFFDVDLNCLASQPLTASDTAWASVPFPFGGPLLSTAGARAKDSATVDSLFMFAGQVLLGAPVPDSSLIPAPTTMDCAVPDAVTVAEVVNLFTSVTAFNAAIKAEADERGWAFIDPNDLLQQLSADTAAIRPFPAFPGTAAPSATSDTPFGTALSLDGLHPSAATHKSFANEVIEAINSKYNTSIPSVP